jgi:hypothetical protein
MRVAARLQLGFCAVVCVWAALACPACDRARDSGSRATAACAPADAGKVVDPVLLAFLSRARAAHHIADQREEANQESAAISVLEELVRGPMPRGADGSPEVHEVLADTRARLADLKSRIGRFDEASRDVDQGLALVADPNYFRGHLFEVRGLLEERRAQALAGKQAEADTAKRAALAAFEEAMRIQSQVIQTAVPDAGH